MAETLRGFKVFQHNYVPCSWLRSAWQCTERQQPAVRGVSGIVIWLPMFVAIVRGGVFPSLQLHYSSVGSICTAYFASLAHQSGSR